MNIGDLFLTLLADGSRLEADVTKQATAAADKAGSKAGTTLGQRMSKNAGRALTAGGAAIGTFVAGGIEKFGAFQERMNEVFTLMPGITDSAMSQMSDDVKAFSRETGRTTEEVVPALYQAISAGVPPDNVFEFMRTANKAAVAGAASTTDSINLLSAVTKGYGDTSEAATAKAADLAFETVKLGQTTYPELAASIGKVVPLAAALGVEQEELFGITATLTGVTGNTAEVMTQQKAAMTALIKANPKMAAGLKEIGFETGTAAVESLGLMGTFEALQKATGGNTQEMAEMLGSTEALTAVLALTGAQSEVAAEKISAMGEASGGVDEAFKVMDSGIAATGRKIAATVGSIAIDVGEKFQAVGPALLAMNQAGQLFGVSPARLFGGLTGAVTGKAIPGLLRAFRGVGAKIGARLGIGIASSIASTATANAVSGAVGDLVGDGVSGAVKSSRLTSATNALGKFLGSKLGMGLAIAFAAIAWVEVINTYNRIKGELAAQNDQISKGVAEQIRSGTTVSLEESKAAIEQGLEDLNGVWDAGIFTTDTRRRLEADLAATEAELARRASGLGPAIAGGIDSGAPAVDTALDDLVDEGKGRVRGGSWGEEGKKIPESIAAGILAKQDEPVDAMDTLKNLMKNALTPSKEIARNIGILTSKELAAGLKDRRPAVREEARRVQAVAEARLAELIAGGGKVGKKASAELAAGLKSKNPTVRAAAQRVKDIVTSKLDQTKGSATKAGGRAGNAYIAELKRRIGGFTVTATYGFRAATSTSLGARASGGPVVAGVPYLVNEQTPRSEVMVPSTGGYILTRAQAEAAMRSGSGGGDVNIGGGIHLHGVGSDVSLGAQRRFAQGVLDVVANGLREQQARRAG